MNLLFGFNAILVCLPVFFSAALTKDEAGNVISDQTGVIELLLPLNTAALVVTHIFNMCIDINSILKPYVVMRIGAVGLLAVYILIGVFQSCPWVVVICKLFYFLRGFPGHRGDPSVDHIDLFS